MGPLEPCGDRTSPPEPVQGRTLFGVFQWTHTQPVRWAFTRFGPNSVNRPVSFKVSHYPRWPPRAGLRYTNGY